MNLTCRDRVVNFLPLVARGLGAVLIIAGFAKMADTAAPIVLQLFEIPVWLLQVTCQAEILVGLWLLRGGAFEPLA